MIFVIVDGTAIKGKIDSTLKEIKKCLGYWDEFAPKNRFPSGKNEEDALRSVIERVNEDGDEDSINDIQEQDGSDSDDEISNMPSFIPAFMLFGPYGMIKWNLELCELVTVDTEAVDEKQKSEKKLKRERVASSAEPVDLTESDRVRGLNIDRQQERQRLIIEAETAHLAHVQQTRIGYQQIFDAAMQMFDRYKLVNDEMNMCAQLKIMNDCQQNMMKPILPPPHLASIMQSGMTINTLASAAAAAAANAVPPPPPALTASSLQSPLPVAATTTTHQVSSSSLSATMVIATPSSGNNEEVPPPPAAKKRKQN